MAPFSLLLGTLLAGIILFAGSLLITLALLERRTRSTRRRAELQSRPGAEPGRWNAGDFGGRAG
jgi:hypothetical protein